MFSAIRHCALALLSATVSPFLSGSPASAVLVNVAGTVYDVTLSSRAVALVG
jgi:hypothetical protein